MSLRLPNPPLRAPDAESGSAPPKSATASPSSATTRSSTGCCPSSKAIATPIRRCRIYLIPYDDNVEMTRRAAEIYGATYVDEEPVEIDRLSQELYPGIFNT